MRSAVLAAVLLLITPAAHAADGLIDFDALPDAPGRSLYGENLAGLCRGSDEYGNCTATIGAVLDVLDAVEAAHPTARVYCPEVRPVPVEDARRVVNAWMDRNRDHLRAPGAWVVMEALREAYPCREDPA